MRQDYCEISQLHGQQFGKNDKRQNPSALKLKLSRDEFLIGAITNGS